MSAGNPQPLEFLCPKCGKRLKANSSVAGRRVKCPQCAHVVRVPGMTADKASADEEWLSLEPVPAPPNTKPTASPAGRSSAAVRPSAPSSPAPSSANTGTPATPKSNRLAPQPTKINDPKTVEPQIVAKHLAELNLDELRLSPLDEPAPPTVKSQPASPPARPKPASSIKRSSFEDDLPDLASLDEQVRPIPIPSLLDLEGLDQLAKTAPSAYQDDEASDTEDYRVTCKTCGTPQYVSLDRVGSKVNCPDCFTNFVVPPPPPGWSRRKKRVVLEDNAPDVPLAPIEVEHHQNTLEAERVAATEYLHKAQKALDDEELEDLYKGHYDTAGFFQRTFGFMRDPNMLLLLVVFGFVFAGLFGLANYCSDKIAIGGFEGAGHLLVLFIGVGLIASIITLPMLASGLALIESVANQQSRVNELPGFNVFDNFGEIILIFFALAASLLPGVLVGGIIGKSGGAEWMILTGMMLTCFATFPVFLLSMLDNGSIFAPLSGDVVKSITQVPEAWGAYYLKNMMAYSFVTVCWYVLLGRGVVASGIGGLLLPWLLFFTCQQMGTLANQIAEHLSFYFTPRKKDAASDQASEGTPAADGYQH